MGVLKRGDTHDEARYYRIISADTSGAFKFTVEDYYSSGQIQMRGMYRSIRPDNKDGHFIYYFENGERQMECHYRDNLLNGPFKEWFESGQLKVSQGFQNDLLDGLYSSWHEDGTRKLQLYYSGGKKNGLFVSYHKNGQKLRSDLYQNDILIEGQCFTPQGEPAEYYPYIIMPRFPGGRSGLRKFFGDELKYPPEARRRGLEGSVIVLFTVDEEGGVRNPRIIDADHESFRNEALRLIGLMPLWIPGEVDSIPSPVQVSVPIEFRLR